LGSSKKAVALPSLAKKGCTIGGEVEGVGENGAGFGRGVGANIMPAAYE